MSETYEVHVSAQHWAEGCDYELGTVASQNCPVWRAMAEAGVPVSSVGRWDWSDNAYTSRDFPAEVSEAIWQFDQFRVGASFAVPPPLTFCVQVGL